MAAIVWSLQAEDDLTDIASYISADSEHYATVFVMDVLEAIDHLADFPLMGRVVPEFNDSYIRELPLGSYGIVYRVLDSSTVEIATIYHGARLLPLDPPH
jgi:toxin ParE1/3/4